jgi:transposase-like protein
VALEALKERQTLNELASERGIHPSQITQWKKQVQEGLVELFRTRRKTEEQALQAREPALVQTGGGVLQQDRATA